MSLCINPNCQNTDNPDNLLRCQSCGSGLLLEGCYRVTRPIGKGGFAKTFEVNDSGNPYTAGLNWRVEANHISPLLANFIDHLMMRPVKDRPANTQAILQRLAEINETLYPTKLTQSKSSKPPFTVKI